jgi:hypothetical protein
MSGEKSFEEALEGFIPVPESERDELLEHAWELLARNGGSGFEHLERQAAVGLSSADPDHLMVQAIERMDTGEVYTTVEVEGGRITRIDRVAAGQDGAALPSNEHSTDDDEPRLRRGDLDLMEELYAHPERFVDYNFDDGPSWLRTDRTASAEFPTDLDLGDSAD